MALSVAVIDTTSERATVGLCFRLSQLFGSLRAVDNRIGLRFRQQRFDLRHSYST